MIHLYILYIKINLMAEVYTTFVKIFIYELAQCNFNMEIYSLYKSMCEFCYGNLDDHCLLYRIATAILLNIHVYVQNSNYIYIYYRLGCPKFGINMIKRVKVIKI